MSYDTWAHEYASDPNVVGSTFRINTQPVTIIGIAPKGYFGDRLTSNPPNFYLPLESMAVILNVPYVHDPEVAWVYVVGRVKPGVSLAAVQAKASAMLRQQFSTFKIFRPNAERHFLLAPTSFSHREAPASSSYRTTPSRSFISSSGSPVLFFSSPAPTSPICNWCAA